MAKLFLSYSRKDALRAQRFTEWLEKQGHDVWRDEDDIRGGASFSNEIEAALEDCDAVVVLWSAESIKSPWVRDEAGFGRDNGKLIPLALDGTLPPLGFRQFQSIDLSKWKGKGDLARSEQILRAIETVQGSSHGQRSTFAAKVLKPAANTRLPSRKVLIVALLAIIIFGAALLTWRSFSRDSSITIAVAPSPTSPDRATATDYANVTAADMASFLPAHFDRATVIAPDASASGRIYRVAISTNKHGSGADASLTLSDIDGHTILWSKSWNVPDRAAVDTREEISRSASQVALCLTEARGGRKQLVQPALSLYLRGCAGVSDSDLSDSELLALFERVVKLAPDFPRGWDYLAVGRAVAAAAPLSAGGAIDPAAEKLARQAIGKARELNPQSGLSYLAEVTLTPGNHLGALALMEKAVALDPNESLLQTELSNDLRSTGRMRDSVQAAKRAVELDPLSSLVRSNFISALTYAGQFSRVEADLADARKKFPNDLSIDFAEFGFQYRYGDPRAAEKLMTRVLDFSDARLAPYRKILAAREDPTPAKVDEAIAPWAIESTLHDRNKYLLALGLFGKTNEVYSLLADAKFRSVADPDILFRPEFARVRADPRFMRVAAQLGLVKYWRQSGHWPDFCTTEKLPYDCKSQAGKL